MQGKITLLSPKKVSPEEDLKLLQSALALHGYTLLKKAESFWIVPAQQAAQTETTIEVVPLNYARADEVAETLSWIAPPVVQVIPYSPTNSIIISGNPEAVEQLLGILRKLMVSKRTRKMSTISLMTLSILCQYYRARRKTIERYQLCAWGPIP